MGDDEKLNLDDADILGAVSEGGLDDSPKDEAGADADTKKSGSDYNNFDSSGSLLKNASGSVGSLFYGSNGSTELNATSVFNTVNDGNNHSDKTLSGSTDNTNNKFFIPSLNKSTDSNDDSVIENSEKVIWIKKIII